MRGIIRDMGSLFDTVSKEVVPSDGDDLQLQAKSLTIDDRELTKKFVKLWSFGAQWHTLF